MPRDDVVFVRSTARGYKINLNGPKGRFVLDTLAWSGTAVVTTVVNVAAEYLDSARHRRRVGPAVATITVNPRKWQEFSVSAKPQERSNTLAGGMTEYPYHLTDTVGTANNAVWGAFTTDVWIRFVLGTVDSASGFNSGLWYWTTPPTSHDSSTVFLHPGLIPDTTFPNAVKWFKQQKGPPPPHLCDTAHVRKLQGLAEVHEGFTQAAESHYGNLQRAVTKAAFVTTIERAVDRAASSSTFFDATGTGYKEKVFNRLHIVDSTFDANDPRRIFGDQLPSHGTYGALGCLIAKDTTLMVRVP
jgi:hypothetical protein